MRVLILSQHYFPELAGLAQLSTDLAESLAAAGHQVRVLTGARRYRTRGWLPSEESHREVQIHRVRSLGLDGAGPRSRGLEEASLFLSVLGRALRGSILPPGMAPAELLEADAVVAASSPAQLPAVAALAPRLRARPLIHWITDLYPDVATALGTLSPRSPVSRAWSRLQRALDARATATVVLDEAMRRRVLERGAPAERVSVLAPWADGEHLRPRAPDASHPLRRTLGLGERFTVSYSGHFGLAHDLSTVAAAMSLSAPVADLHWLLIGEGPRRAEVEAQARRLDPARVTLLGPRSSEELPISLTAAHASIVSIDRRAAGLVCPSKLAGLLAAGVPVIYVGPFEGAAYEATRAGAGLAVRNGDPDGLLSAIGRLRADPRLRARMAARARELYQRDHARGAALARFHALLESAGTGSPVQICESNGDRRANAKTRDRPALAPRTQASGAEAKRPSPA